MSTGSNFQKALYEAAGYAADDPEMQRIREDTDERMDLVCHLRRARIASGMKQSEVADRMHTSQSVVSKLEQTGGDPRLSMLQAYARAIGVRIPLRARPDDSGTWSHPFELNAFRVNATMRPTVVEPLSAPDFGQRLGA